MDNPASPHGGESLRTFTLAEANNLVPKLEEAFTRIYQLWIAAQGFYGALKDKLSDDKPRYPQYLKDPEFARDYGKFKALMEALRDELKDIEALGVLIRSIEKGIVDFYSQKGGKAFFLCWSYGEPEILYWHDLEAGFQGRRPLQELEEP